MTLPSPPLDLRGATIVDRSMVHAFLRGADLRGAHLQRVDLTDADLTGAKLDGAVLDDVILHRAKLDRATLQSTTLRSSDLRDLRCDGADATFANLVSCDVRGAGLGGADVRGARFVDCHHDGGLAAIASGAEVRDLDGRAADELRRALRSPVPPPDGIHLATDARTYGPGAIERVVGITQHLNGALAQLSRSFSSTELAAMDRIEELEIELDAHIASVTSAADPGRPQDRAAMSALLRHVDGLQHLSARAAALARPTTTAGAALREAARTSIARADVEIAAVQADRTWLWERFQHQQAAVELVRQLDRHEQHLPGSAGGQRLLRDAPPLALPARNLQRLNLSAQVLPTHTDLRWCDLRGAHLPGLDASDAQLEGARLDGATLDGAKLAGARMYGATLHGASARSADLSGSDLRAAKAEGLDLAGADLTGADLTGANLDGIDLRSAKVDGAKLDNHQLSTVVLTPRQRKAIVIATPTNAAGGPRRRPSERRAPGFGPGR